MRPSLALLTSSRGVFVRLPIIRHLGSGSAAIMLAQVVWLLAETPDAEIVRGDHEWDQDTGLTARQARRARETLVAAGVVTVKKRRVDGAPTSCIRLDLDGLDRLMEGASGEPVDAREVRGETFRPNGQISFDQNGGTTSIREVVQIEASRSAPSPSDDVEHLCGLLADLIEQNGAKRPTISKQWLAECDRMIRLDGRTPAQVESCIRWCQADDFWSTVVLSMPKVRKHFDQMSLQAKKRRTNGKPNAMDGALEYARREGLL